MKNTSEIDKTNNMHSTYLNSYEIDQEKNADSQDSDELIAKIYEDNLNNLANLTGWMQIAEIVLIISFIALFISLIFKYTSHGGFSWIYVLIPTIATIISGLIAANLFLGIKDILEKTEDQIKESNSKNNNNKNIDNNNINNIHENSPSKFVSIFSYIIINSMFALLLIFVLILAFKLQQLINIKQIHVLFTPIYALLVLGILYSIFISPAFFKNGLYFEIFLIFIYQISAFIFFLLLGDKINHPNSRLKYAYIFIAYYLPISAHILNCILSMTIKKEKLLSNILSIFSLLFFLVGGLLIQLKNDLIIKNEKHYIDILLLFCGFMVFALDSLINMYFVDLTNEKND